MVEIIVLANRVFGHHLDTQTLNNHTPGHPKYLMGNIKQSKVEGYEVFTLEK